MNWGGLMAGAGLVFVAFYSAPWGLLILLIPVLLVFAPRRASGQSPSTAATPSSPAQRIPEALAQLSSTSQVKASVFMQSNGRPHRAESSRDAHFKRHAHTPGWLYVARQDFRPADTFKVGYTTQSPQQRIKRLNDQARGVTAAVGRFTLVHSRRVPRSQTAEARVFGRLAAYRVIAHREFFQAPLNVIVDAIEAEAHPMAGEGKTPAPAAILLWSACPDCGRAVQFSASQAAPEVELACPPCGTAWVHACVEGDFEPTGQHEVTPP